MSQGRTASAPYTIKNGVYPVVRLGVVRSPQSTESSSSTQCLSNSFKDRTSLGLMPLIIRPLAFDLTICLRAIDGGVIELNAQIGAPVSHLVGCEIGAVIGDD